MIPPHDAVLPTRLPALPSAGALRASAAAAAGLLLALPWRLDAPPLLAAVAAWLAVVALARAAPSPNPRHADDAEPHDPRLAPLLAVLLMGLVRPIAGAVVAGGWLVRRALSARPARAAAGLDEALRDIALPAIAVWTAFGGDRGLDAGAVAGAHGGLPFAAWLGANAAAVGTIAGWTAVFAAAPTAAVGLTMRRLATAAGAWSVVLASAIAADSVGAVLAGVAFGLGLWAGPSRSAANVARWRSLAVAGLLAAAAGLAIGR